jgi:formylglycine-generating enzyme required for sulfatase activity
MNFSQFSHFAWVRNHVLAASVFCFAGLGASANNIQVSNVTLTGQDVSAGVNNAANFTYIEFDLTWENSWRTSASPNNWDAAWVFIKFKTVGGSTWNHVYLAPSGHNTSPTTPSTSYSVQVGLVDESIAHNATTNPAVGAFIYRSADGTGTFTAQDIRLKWFYRNNNVGDNDIIDVDVYAIEMVYVPDGAFWVGNNGSSTNASLAFYTSGGTSSYNVITEGSIAAGTAGANAGSLVIPGYDGGANMTIPAAFPKGFKGFYCMKYEASQQHWVDFLNTLTSAQQANLATSAGARNGITSTANVYSTTLPFVPMNRVIWPDVAAYLDWAGLRVMTELEFEKACRGASVTNNVVTDEFAWGTANYTSHTNTSPTSAGLTNEVSSVAGANTNLAHTTITTNQPLRSGSFATSSSSRIQAGATFYGIMDMTGNVYEQVATIVNVSSSISSYSGLHGNGLLTSGGYADVTNWPGLSSGAVTPSGLTAAALGQKGAGWFNANGSAAYINPGRVADRYWAPRGAGLSGSIFPSSSSGDWGNYEKGVRGVHTKPITASETK